VLKALREAGDSLLAEFQGLSEAQLTWRAADGEWSLKETIGHLRDAERLALAQLTTIVEGSGESLPAWNLDLLPLERNYQAADPAALLTELRRLRRQTTYLLWGLLEDEWQREGKHPFRGPLALAQIARELAQHDLEHLWWVRRLKEDMA